MSNLTFFTKPTLTPPGLGNPCIIPMMLSTSEYTVKSCILCLSMGDLNGVKYEMSWQSKIRHLFSVSFEVKGDSSCKRTICTTWKVLKWLIHIWHLEEILTYGICSTNVRQPFLVLWFSEKRATNLKVHKLSTWRATALCTHPWCWWAKVKNSAKSVIKAAQIRHGYYNRNQDSWDRQIDL